MTTINESAIASTDWRVDLRHQIEQLAGKNDSLKQHLFLNDKTKEMDQMILELRFKLNEDEITAAQYHLKCLCFLDEMNRFLNQHLMKSKLKNLSTRRNTVQLQDSNGSISNFETSFGASNYLYGMRRFDTIPQRRNILERIQIKNRILKFLFGLSDEDLTPTSINTDEEDQTVVRDLWSTQITFFLSCLGFIIGVGNTLRFPAMIYQYGGGVFMIPYILFLIIFGFPLVYLHLCIGQYSGLSASGAFSKMMPAASGIGWALVILAIPVCIYYNIVIAWSLYYFWYAVTSPFTASAQNMGWNHCTPSWSARYNCCDIVGNVSCYMNVNAISSSEAFFHHQVLNRTLIDKPYLGDLQPHLFWSLAVAWILVYLGVSKGIGSIGWAVTFTTTIPYLLCVILLLRGISLPGSEIGLKFLFTADMSKLWNLDMWKASAEQVFYSLDKLNANWTAYSLALIQVILVCHVYGVDNFQEDIRDMLRIPVFSEQKKIPYAVVQRWKEFKHCIGPVGNYIKYCWAYLSPIILSSLLLASIWSYERVRFNNEVLPFYYELIAWITMVGPLFIVPIIFIHHLVMTRRQGKLIKSIFDTSKWREVTDEVVDVKFESYDEDYDHNFAVIDQISRNVSMKSNVFPSSSMIIRRPQRNTNVPSIIHEESFSKRSRDGYGSVVDIHKDSIMSRDGSESEEEQDTRMNGRIKDWERSNVSPENDMPYQNLFSKSENTPHKFSIPESISSEKGVTSFNLFGPPPAKTSLTNSTSTVNSMSRHPIRRSDQRKNKVFDIAQPFNIQCYPEKDSATFIKPNPKKKKKISDEGHMFKLNEVDEGDIQNSEDEEYYNNQGTSLSRFHAPLEINVTNLSIREPPEKTLMFQTTMRDVPTKWPKSSIKLKRPKPIEAPISFI
uniref:Transporter n=1 Tax=Rhabditophanes sp. KR3021 TaxID=114890 RepID=A0AC35UD52_9BILA